MRSSELVGQMLGAMWSYRLLAIHSWAVNKQSSNYQEMCLSQISFGNPKGPVELGNPNTCAETKLCLILFIPPQEVVLL